MITNKKIAIVGGGPGGLTLARLLQIKGADVKVYERDLNRNVRVQGATLDLHEESGLAALKEAGLMPAFEANYRPGAEKVRITDQRLNILLDEHTLESRVNDRPEIDRGPLRNILLDSLQPGTVVWDSQFQNMSKINGQWQLVFKNGSIASADIVIAADGANSRLRPYITPIKPFYSGVTAIEATIYNSAIATPHIHGLLKDGKIFAFGDQKSLIVSSKGDGSLAFYPGFKAPENWVSTSGIDFDDPAQVLAWFRNEYSGWDEGWHELFQVPGTHFIPRPQYCMPLDQHWESLPDLTMLGDAAHLMPPYAGEGVNMAMLDALELSRCLVSSSIAEYEKQMLARASEIAALTLHQTEVLHSHGAIENLLSIMGEYR